MRAWTLLALVPLTAFAAPPPAMTLDQSYWPATVDYEATIGRLSSGNSYAVFQSFTVGVDGVLQQLDVSVSKFGAVSDAMLLEIVPGNDPTGSPLASFTIPASAVTATAAGYTGALPVLSVDVSSAGLTVYRGDFLGFRLSSTVLADANVNQYWSYFQNADAYAGGVGNHIATGTVEPNTGWDFYFRTYVNAPGHVKKRTPRK